MQEITGETRLTDRELLVHAIAHLEDLDAKITAMHDIVQAYKPLIDRFAPGGGADYLTILQTARDLRRRRT